LISYGSGQLPSYAKGLSFNEKTGIQASAFFMPEAQAWSGVNQKIAAV
jgi:hypothetical protein